MAVSMFAVPAYRGWQTKTLPDGSQITVRQMGDEFFHYWETEDGKQAFEQADGRFVVTGEAVPTKAQARAKRAASTLQSSKPRKAIGERNLAPRGLLVLVQFSDVTFKSANNNAAFNDMLNKAGYDYNGATGSAVDYFHAQSNNAYNPTFDVVGPVTLSHNLEYYGEQGTINGYKENDMYIADFVIDAVTAAESAGCDFSKYDSNNDGYVDIVYFIYAGKGQANGGSTETIWPHNWELISALYYEQTHGGSGYYVYANNQGYITSMNIPTFDGKKINNYACSAELRGDGNRSGIGTFCHEFSHVLGLPDYYDADGEDNGENVQTPQEWSIMDYGSYNNNEMTPPNYSIYDKYFMGWATPKFLAKDEKKDVSLTTGYDDAYQITGGSSLVAFTNTGTVYYLENRQKTGWDAALPGHGMLVWQVKYSASVWENNAPNNTAGNARYTIIPANGRTSNYGYGSDPFPGTSNVKSYTPATGCALTQISENDGVISFKYNGGEVNYWTYGIEGEHCTVPADGTVDKGVALNLTITPDAGYTLADADCWAVEMGNELLAYGTGFTYNENNGAFAISSVTGDVYIVASAKAIPFTITWMADGAEFTTTQSTGSVVLPTSEPAACDGKAFVGWCADAHYESETTAPTFVKNGDAVTEATTFYAVYATPGTGGITDGSKTFKFSEIASANNWQNGESYTTIEIAPVTVKANGGGYNGKWYTSSNGSWRMYSGGTVVITVAEGAVTSVTSSPTCNWTISDGKATFSPSARTDFTQIVVNYTVASGGTSYSDYTTSCTPAAPVYYTIRFFDQGTKVSEQSVLKGQTPEVPANPTAACEDYTFYGWWTAELAADNTTAQKVTNFTATKDQDYYAIYSKKVTSGANIIQLDATKDTTFPKDGITLTVSNGVLDNKTDYRVYKGATLTISSSVGNMSNIALTYVDSYDGGGWASSYQPNAATWTSPQTTTGGSGKQARIKLIEITIGEGASPTTYYTSTVDCNWPTDVEESKVEPVAVKALRNGQIVIIRADAVYSITGARIE